MPICWSDQLKEISLHIMWWHLLFWKLLSQPAAVDIIIAVMFIFWTWSAATRWKAADVMTKANATRSWRSHVNINVQPSWTNVFPRKITSHDDYYNCLILCILLPRQADINLLKRNAIALMFNATNVVCFRRHNKLVQGHHQNGCQATLRPHIFSYILFDLSEIPLGHRCSNLYDCSWHHSTASHCVLRCAPLTGWLKLEKGGGFSAPCLGVRGTWGLE